MFSFWLLLVTCCLHFGSPQRANQVVLTCEGPVVTYKRGVRGYLWRRVARLRLKVKAIEDLLNVTDISKETTGTVKNLKDQANITNGYQEKIRRLESRLQQTTEEFAATTKLLQDRLRRLEEQLHVTTGGEVLVWDSDENVGPATKDCDDVKAKGHTNSDVYRLASPSPYKGFCDMETDGGGWLVFQKRFDGSTDFYRNWTEYMNGFGNVDGEFWLGLEMLHEITKNGGYELRVDLEWYNAEKQFAIYRDFSVGSAETYYRLSIGEYRGTAGDSLSGGTRFETRDMTGDARHNCGEMLKGGWWYGRCGNSNLNGRFSSDPALGEIFNFWITPPSDLRSSRRRSEMKIRKMRG